MLVQAADGATVAGATVVSFSSILFTPTAALKSKTVYTITVTHAGALKSVGQFTTGTDQTTPPPFQVTNYYPTANQYNVLLTDLFHIRFSNPIIPTTVSSNLTYTEASANSNPRTASVNSPGAFELTGVPNQPFAIGDFTYSFSDFTIEDIYGQKLASPQPLKVSFSTLLAPVEARVHFVHSLPGDQEAGVPTNSAIYLEFDGPVSPLGAQFELSAASDPAAQVQVTPINDTSRYLVLQPKLLLRPDTDYTLSIIKLRDSAGTQYSFPNVVHFHTAQLPVARPLTIVSQPAFTMPLVSKLRWTFDRPIHPYRLPGLYQISPNGSSAIPLPLRLSADGMTLEGDVPAAGFYRLYPAPYDRVTSTPATIIGYLTDSVTVTSVADQKPPRIVATSPVDQSTATPGALISILFDKVIPPVLPSQVVLTSNGVRLAVDAASSTNSGQFFRPHVPLVDGQAYQVTLTGLHDYAGNVSQDQSWTFQVGPDSSEPFRLVDVSPMANSLNLDPQTPVTFTFNRPPSLVSLGNLSYSQRVNTTTGSIIGQWTASGNSATFRPSLPMPSGQVSCSLIGVTDYSGAPLDNASDWSAWVTNPATDYPAPKVIAVSPSGSELSYQTITLDFDQPLNPATVSNSILYNYYPPTTNIPIYASVNYDPELRRVTITFDLSGRDGTFRVVVAPSLLSLYGTPAEPFSGEFRLRISALSYGLGTAQTEPPPFLSSLFPNAQRLQVDRPIIIRFSGAYPQATVESALQIVIAGQIQKGRFQWTPDGLAVSFYPSAPLPAQQSGYVYLNRSPLGGAGGEVIWFTTDLAPRAPTVQTSIVGPAPGDAWIEVQLAQDQPAGYLQHVVLYSGSQATRQDVPVQTEIRSASRFRVRPLQTPVSGFYTLEAQIQGSTGLITANVVFDASTLTPLSREIYAGPTDLMGAVPVNGVIWMRAQTMLNPLTVKPSVTWNGIEQPFTVAFADSGRAVQITPKGLLQGNSVYTVYLTGIEDMAGRPLPPQGWTFHTGAGIDVRGGAVVSAAPITSAGRDVIPHVTFDVPVFLLSADNTSNNRIPPEFSRNTDTGGLVTAHIRPSADQRTMFFVPDSLWPAGSSINLQSYDQRFVTWTGLEINNVGQTFTATDNPLTSPVSVALTPARDATDVPLNSRVRVRFDQEILPESVSGVRLELDGIFQPINVTLDSSHTVLEVFPPGLLPNRIYTVVLEGVQNVNGAARDQAERWSFQTGTIAWTGSPIESAKVISENPLQLQVFFSRAVDAVSAYGPTYLLQLQGASVAADVTLAADGRSLTVIPVVPAASLGSRYMVTFRRIGTQLTDLAGKSIGLTVVALIAGDGGSVDDAAPRVLAVSPADGSVNSPNLLAAVVFDKPVAAGGAVISAVVTNRGRRLPATVTISPAANPAVTITPLFSWLPGETYEVQLSGLIDASGNAAPTVTWSFSIAADGLRDDAPPKLISSIPAVGAVGVAPEAPLVLRFSRPVIPASSPTLYQYLPKSGQIISPLDATYDGATVTLTPRSTPPGGLLTDVLMTVQSSNGLSGTPSLSYTTAGMPDTTPPTLELISPAPGAAIVSGSNTFLLRFSEPVNLPPSGIGFTNSGNVSILFRDDGRSVFVILDAPVGPGIGVLNLQGSITDLSGNAFVGRTIQYNVLSPDASALPRLVSTLPANGDINVPADATVALQFNQPMNETAMRGGIKVYDNGEPVSFQLASESDGRVWRITPDSAWLAGSTVEIAAGTLYADSGILLAYTPPIVFHIAAASAGAEVNVTGLLSSTTGIDVRFGSPAVDSGGLMLRQGQQRVATHVERVGPNWLRVVPDEPLTIGASYVLLTGAGTEFPIVPGAEPLPAIDGELKFTVEGATRLTFETPVHPFGYPAGFQVLDSKGEPVSFRLLLSDDGKRGVIETYRQAGNESIRAGGKK